MLELVWVRTAHVAGYSKSSNRVCNAGIFDENGSISITQEGRDGYNSETGLLMWSKGQSCIPPSWSQNMKPKTTKMIPRHYHLTPELILRIKWQANNSSKNLTSLAAGCKLISFSPGPKRPRLSSSYVLYTSFPITFNLNLCDDTLTYHPTLSGQFPYKTKALSMSIFCTKS